LTGAAQGWSGPLILRLFARHHDPRRPLLEAVVQNTLADLGYPVPRALLASGDAAALGGPFVVMDRAPGRPLLRARMLGVGAVLADLQSRLHELDASVLLDALDRDGPPPGRELVTFDGYLAQFHARIDKGALEGLRPAIEWVMAHRPREALRPSICHGDFHPHNILHDGRRATAVLDWPNIVVADPAYDVASTLLILRHTPIELSGSPRAMLWMVRVARRVLIVRYLRGYRQRRPIDLASLPYYEAAAAIRALVRAAERRPQQRRGVENPLDASPYADRLAARFAAITGVLPVVPAPRA